MNRLWLAFVLVAGIAGSLAAQEPEPADTAGAERLRAEVERRFAERVQAQLGLTGDQVTKLRSTQERFGVRRRALLRAQVIHRLALQEQMRREGAANADSVRFHMDGLQAGRADLVRLEQDEDREMSDYLTPLQRAQFQMLRQRLWDRMSELRRDRQERRRERLDRRPGAGRTRRRP